MTQSQFEYYPFNLYKGTIFEQVCEMSAALYFWSDDDVGRATLNFIFKKHSESSINFFGYLIKIKMLIFAF